MEYSDAVMRLGRDKWLVAGFLLCAGCRFALAEVTELKGSDSYQVIVVRNPFGLKDPPPALGPEATNPPPVKVDVKFTGITANPAGKKAWFMIPPQPGKAPTPKCFSIAEGGKENDIEVLEINENAATVKILNAGVPVVLNFREHGLAAPATLAVPSAAPAGAPGAKIPGAPAPGVPPPAPTAYAPAGSVVTPGAVASAPQAVLDNAAASSARTIPPRNLRTSAVDAGGGQAPAAVDPAVQYIQMRVQHQAAQQQGINLPPLPPIPGMQAE